jgi:integrase
VRKVRFTKPSVKALRPEAKRYDVYDDSDNRGLAVTILPSGCRTWYLIRKVRGRVERVKLGNVADLSPEAARKKAAKVNATIADGRSPSEERRAIRSEMSLGALWTAFLERHAKPRKRSWRTDELRWKRHLSHWQSRKLSSITRPDVARLLAAIAASSGPIAANRARALLHTLFALAATWGANLQNPAAGTPRNRETSKDRYLLPDELRRLLAALDEDHDADTADFLRLLLYTGVRRGSLCAARWEDIAIADALWRIPGEYMKAGRSLELPLAPAAVAILRERQERAVPGAVSVWVFPGRRNGHTAGPQRGFARVCGRAGITDLTPHDLRRSFAVYAQESGVQLAIVARLLGHGTVGGITGKVYALVTPSAVRAGVEKAVRYMLRVAAGTAKVIPFPAAGKP